MIIDMAPIYKCPKVPVYDGLWKYENTPYSRPGLKKFEHENYYIYYTIEELYLDGKLVCKDNIGKEYKINLKLDLNKACGIHLSLRNMELNEKAVFRVSPILRKSLEQLEFQTENKVVQYVSEEDKARADKDQIWIIDMIKVVEKYDHLTNSFENRSNQIEVINKNAQQLFQKEQYKEASDLYKQIRVYSDGIPNEQKQKWTEEQCNYMYSQSTKSYLNQAVCALKMKEWHIVKDLCNSALIISPFNTKAKILIARSMFERRLLDEAKVLFQKILDDEKFIKTQDQINDIQNYLNQCSLYYMINFSDYSTKKEKIVYQKIFERINEKDADLDRMEKTHKLEEYEKVKQIKKILDDAQNGGVTKDNEFQKLI